MDIRKAEVSSTIVIVITVKYCLGLILYLFSCESLLEETLDSTDQIPWKRKQLRFDTDHTDYDF